MTAFNLRAVNVHLVETFDDAVAFKTWLGTVEGALGVDIETTGLSPWDPGAGIRLIQFGDDRNGWALPWVEWRGLALEILQRWTGEFVCHNLAFESRWFHVHGDGYRFPIERTHDTMIAARIIDPLSSAALKQLAVRHLDKRAAYGQEALKEKMSKNKWGWDTVPILLPEYWMYGALDPVITRGIHDKFLPYVRAGGAFNKPYDLEMAARHIATSMELKGLRIDPVYAQEQFTRLDNRQDEVIRWGQETYDGINLASTRQLGILVQQLGGEIRDWTAGGSPKTRKEDLKFWANTGSAELAHLSRSVIEMRESDKIAESYFASVLRTRDSNDIVHPEISTLGARTGRMSVSNPPLQQLPSGDPLVRKMFIPREGNKIISCDYNQVELRLMAHFSQDPALIDAFRIADSTGGDFFTALGAQIYGDPSFSKKDPRRGLVKNVMYGRLYGAGVPKMAESAGVPVEQMQVVAEAINDTYPGIEETARKIISLGDERLQYEGQGYVMTPFGRRLPCDADRTYALTNYLIQGHAAEVLKTAIVNLDAAGLGDYMLLPVHDEVLFDVPEDIALEVKHEVGIVMSNTRDYAVAVSADAEGPFDSWGAKYEAA
jgi:DNA polymerase-1